MKDFVCYAVTLDKQPWRKATIDDMLGSMSPTGRLGSFKVGGHPVRELNIIATGMTSNSQTRWFVATKCASEAELVRQLTAHLNANVRIVDAKKLNKSEVFNFTYHDCWDQIDREVAKITATGRGVQGW